MCDKRIVEFKPVRCCHENEVRLCVDHSLRLCCHSLMKTNTVALGFRSSISRLFAQVPGLGVESDSPVWKDKAAHDRHSGSKLRLSWYYLDNVKLKSMVVLNKSFQKNFILQQTKIYHDTNINMFVVVWVVSRLPLPSQQMPYTLKCCLKC